MAHECRPALLILSLRGDSTSSYIANLCDSVSLAPVLNGLDLKSMQRVAQLPLPEGSQWGGSGGGEKRSINRFLAGVGNIQRLAGLDARAGNNRHVWKGSIVYLIQFSATQKARLGHAQMTR
jgi:hypothetical protein